MLRGKHIVIGITGGIAAYKAATLARLLVKNGAEVQVIMTPNAKEFITPLTLSTITGRPVISEFFTANTGEWHSHVSLGLWADMMIIAPATASTLAKMAHGIADNMLTTSYLSARCKVVVAPAMDFDMWQHPTTARNLDTLRRDGVEVIEPASGELASHLVGKGRMEEPEKIMEHIARMFDAGRSLKGKRVLVTAGPTYENIDPVRFIGNYSSGKMGFALAEECAARGADVVLITGPVSLHTDSPSIRRIDVGSAQEMLSAAEENFESCDMAVLCAAVADYRPALQHEKKIKREGIQTLSIELVRNPDIAATLGKKKGERLLVGFALETDNEHDNAVRKMRSKNLDWIVLNSLRDSEAGFGKDTNKVTLLSAEGEEILFPAKTKREVAADILDVVVRAKG